MFARAIKAELDLAAGIKAKAQSENRIPTEAELSAIESHLAKVEGLKAQQAKAERLEAAFAQADAGSRRVVSPVITDVKEAVLADPKKGFRNSTEYISSLVSEGMGRGMDKRLRPLATVGSDEQSGSTNSYGGFLVPEGFRAELLQLEPEQDVFGSLTMKIPMTTRTLRIPVLENTSHATSVAGGVVCTRRAEAAEGALSRAKYEQVELRCNTLTTFVAVTEELMQDSPISMASIVATQMKKAKVHTLMNERINGTGAGEYEGIVNAPCAVTITKETQADTIVLANIFKMRAACLNYNRAIWLFSPDCLPLLATLGANNVNVWMPSIQQDKPDMLLGRPCIFTEYMPKNVDANAFAVVDPTVYLEATMGGDQFAESDQLRFLAAERVFRLQSRCDGRCWVRSATTPFNGSQSLSPIVLMGDRS